MPREGAARTARLFRDQAGACERLGSPMYAELLGRLADDLEAGGVTRTVLTGHEDDPGPSCGPCFGPDSAPCLGPCCGPFCGSWPFSGRFLIVYASSLATMRHTRGSSWWCTARPCRFSLWVTVKP